MLEAAINLNLFHKFEIIRKLNQEDQVGEQKSILNPWPLYDSALVVYKSRLRHILPDDGLEQYLENIAKASKKRFKCVRCGWTRNLLARLKNLWSQNSHSNYFSR